MRVRYGIPRAVRSSRHSLSDSGQLVTGRRPFGVGLPRLVPEPRTWPRSRRCRGSALVASAQSCRSVAHRLFSGPLFGACVRCGREVSPACAEQIGRGPRSSSLGHFVAASHEVQFGVRVMTSLESVTIGHSPSVRNAPGPGESSDSARKPTSSQSCLPTV
jgi:hypothetical protein